MKPNDEILQINGPVIGTGA